MSTVRTNNILDAAGGNTAAINGMTPTAQSLQGFRNRIINGDMRIDQRNAGASVTTNAAFAVDRWQFWSSQTSRFSVQQNNGSVTPPSGFRNYLGAAVTSPLSVGAGDYFTLQQRVEGHNFADMGWGTVNAQPVTLSFWTRSSLTGTFGGSFVNNATNRSYPFTYTISASNTWEYKTITVAGDTSGTWATDNSIGVSVFFGMGAGSTFSGTAGAWAGAYFLTATGAVSVVGTNGATFYITGVQLEAGSVATPFERRDYGRELMMCQRYYEKSYNIDVVLGTSTLVGISASPANGSGNAIYGTSIVFKATKRANPTMSGWTYTGTAGSWHYGVAGASEGVTSINFGNIAMTSTQPFMTTTPGSQNTMYGHWAASSEL